LGEREYLLPASAACLSLARQFSRCGATALGWANAAATESASLHGATANVAARDAAMGSRRSFVA